MFKESLKNVGEIENFYPVASKVYSFLIFYENIFQWSFYYKNVQDKRWI